MPETERYYRPDLALVHHRGYGFHADRCAQGILRLLEPVRRRDGLVLELGCGSGALTRYLVDAGHRVVATDASPAMLDLARETLGNEVDDLRQLVLPDDPLPECDAIVSIGHVLSYLPDENSIDRALVAAATALRADGVFAIDLCDLLWGTDFSDVPVARLGDDWAIISRFDWPTPGRFVREMTTFVRQPDGTWRRDDETHRNVLIDTAGVPALLAEHGLRVHVGNSFADEPLTPEGLATVVGHKGPTTPMFVYGTLMFPEVQKAVLGRVPASETAAITGWRAAALEGRPYPGLVEADPSVQTVGWILLDLRPHEREAIDEFEDNLYDLVEITLDDGRQALTYVWRDAAEVLEHDWDLGHFAAVDLPDFLSR